MVDIPVLVSEILQRFVVLVLAPLTDEKMLWAAIPLAIATLFVTLYFGKYKNEELGWNTAFSNTMVFLFVSINIIQYIFYYEANSSWDRLISSPFHSTVTFGLICTAFFLMLITYYHLLPKKVAFFLFSAPPVNVAVYVLMTIVYTGVPADYTTILAALLLFVIIFAILRAIQLLEQMSGSPDGLKMPFEEIPKEKLLKNVRENTNKLEEERMKKKIEEDKLEKKESSTKEASQTH